MKKIFIIAVIVVAAALIVPGVVGYQAEQRYQALVDQLPAAGLEVVENRYQRGWFGAEAMTRIRWSAGPAAPDPVELVLRSRIAHGPLTRQGVALADIDTDLEADGESLLSDTRSTIRTEIAIDGTGHTRIQVPQQALRQPAEEPDVLFRGLTGEIDFDLEREQGRFRFRSPGLKVHQDGRILAELVNLSLDSRTWRGASGLMLGEGRFLIDRITVDDDDLEGRLEIRTLAMRAVSEEQGGRKDLVSVMVEYGLGSLDYRDQHYSDGLLRMKLERLYAPVLLQIQEISEQIRRQQMSEAEMGMAMVSLFSNRAPDLLKRDPAVILEPIRLTAPEGMLEAGLSIRARGLTVADLANQSRLLSRLEAEARLSVPEVLFHKLLVEQNQADLLAQAAAAQPQGEDAGPVDGGKLQAQALQMADAQLKQWLDQRLLQRQEGVLRTRVTLAAGRLRINGQEIPLPGQ